ncbi:MAG TPA: maltose acetyltransferase domain-containing protein [Thermoanaerobaculia bacterium]|jgi:hypothetical protein|nr:maltose acetyltransferase domain-containing protein [Thermoanaerobaculia bacterium]
MLAGALYDPLDPELVAARGRKRSDSYAANIENDQLKWKNTHSPRSSSLSRSRQNRPHP